MGFQELVQLHYLVLMELPVIKSTGLDSVQIIKA